MVPSIRPISLHLEVILRCSSSDRYPQAYELSSQCCVSACSPSASDSLLMKWASYRRFCQASAMFAPTESFYPGRLPAILSPFTDPSSGLLLPSVIRHLPSGLSKGNAVNFLTFWYFLPKAMWLQPLVGTRDTWDGTRKDHITIHSDIWSKMGCRFIDGIPFL
jgi:hypothetical protein